MSKQDTGQKTAKAPHRRRRRAVAVFQDFIYGLNALRFTLNIYRQAVGRRSIFNIFYRIFSAIVPSVTAVLAGLVVTEVVNAVTTHNLWPAIFLLLIIFTLKIIDAVLGEIHRIYYFTLDKNVTTFVTKQITSKYFRIPLNVRETQEFADLLDRVKNYGSSIEFASNGALSILSNITSLITVFVTLFVISPILTFVVILSVIPGSIINVKNVMRRQENWRYHTTDRRTAYAIQRKLTEPGAALEVEIYSLPKYLVSKMIKYLRSSEEQNLADAKRIFWPNIGSDFLTNFAEIIVLVCVAFEIMLGRLAVGQFLTIRNLLTQLSTNVSAMFSTVSTMNEYLLRATDYHKFMHLPERPLGELSVSRLPKIEFKNVTFFYTGSKEPALEDVSFVVEPGDKVAIVGENGAGKTTILKLLIGAYQPQSGEILIDGVPMDQIKRSDFLAKIGFLRQEFSRYEFATLGQNVWFGDVSRPYDESAIRTSLRKAGLEDLEKRYPKGLDQILSKDFDPDTPADLSGGQWQRIAIARGFFRSPQILILDEPTSAVDAKSEYKIFQEIMNDQSNKTTIIVSHRFSTVRKASRIIVLNRGKIVEQGSHQQLMRNKGIYHELFSLQAEGFLG